VNVGTDDRLQGPACRALAMLCALTVWISPSFSSAQSLDAVFKGMVTDATGAAIAGATVTVKNLDTGFVDLATTDGTGLYRSALLPAGAYSVTVERKGFWMQVRQGRLHVGAVMTIDFSLELAAQVATLDVVGDAPVLETARNTVSRLVTKEEIDALPVIDRNFNGLASLAPGATPTGTYGGVDIGGSRDFQNGLLVDGLSAESLGAGDQRILYAQDWIREFQVLISQYNAEFGRSSGGVVNVITRSGSNTTSGRAYGFFRNEAWDATPAFATVKAPLQSTRLGGTGAGRVIPNRLFYFAGFEWFDDETSRVVNSAFPERNGSVPATAAQKLYIAKIEGQARAPNLFRIRINGDRRHTTGEGVGGRVTEEFGRSSIYEASDLVGMWTRGLSRSAFNELRGAFVTTSLDTRCNFAEVNPPGSWFAREYPGAFLGCPSTGFGRRDVRELQIVDNFSSTQGTHDLKAGVEVSRARNIGDYRFARDGVYRFDRDVTFDLSNPASYPVSFAWFNGLTTWDYPRWAWGAFVQDSWRVTPDLTMNVGLRYDLDGSFTALNPLVRVDKGLTTIRKDRDNVAPRAGIAWTPFDDGGRTLVRGGVGAYYDENHQNVATLLLNLSILVQRSVMLNASSPLLNPFWPDQAQARRLLAEALAQNTVPDISLLPGIVAGSPDWASDLQVPLTLQASGGISHDFGRGVTVSADAVFARGFDQYVIGDVNIDLDATLQQRRIVRINPNYSFINRYGNDGRFVYRSLQLQASFAPNARHWMKLSYTLSKNESNTNTALEGVGAGGVAGATNAFDFNEDYGPASSDIRHNLAVDGVTTMPLGIQVSAVLAARSALPWSVVANSTGLDDDPFFDRPEPRNSRRGDSYFSLDARITRPIQIGARQTISPFVEIFNLTNATNFIDYVGTPGGSQFGQPTTALGPRRMQFGFRLDF
jgi:carboxypeptidase family protein/TonB-dependent receptor-like protein